MPRGIAGPDADKFEFDQIEFGHQMCSCETRLRIVRPTSTLHGGGSATPEVASPSAGDRGTVGRARVPTNHNCACLARQFRGRRGNIPTLAVWKKLGHRGHG